jgi:hypothetical protein
MAQAPPMQGHRRDDRKDPREAAILGIFVVGLGHLYLGMWAKGIGLFIVTVFAIVLTSVYVAPFFWIISCFWAYSDAKNYNRQAGYPENETDSDEEEEGEIDSDEEEEEMDSSEEGEIDSDEILVKELRAIRSTMNVVAILLLIMAGLMLYVFFHLTRLVLAP